MIKVSERLLLGLDECELVEAPLFACRVHQQMLDPLHCLAQRAAREGFIFKVASSYRSFSRQLLIWNNKALGLRPVLNDVGEVVDITTLSERDKVFAILRWSALPGASRHHWGTDVDVYGAAQLDPDYQLQLTVAETQGDGPFAEFHRWLHDELVLGSGDFYRPYAVDRGGVAPEPWHLSYAPLAALYAPQLTPELLQQQLVRSDIELKKVVLDNLDEIFQRFICVD